MCVIFPSPLYVPAQFLPSMFEKVILVVVPSIFSTDELATIRPFITVITFSPANSTTAGLSKLGSSALSSPVSCTSMYHGNVSLMNVMSNIGKPSEPFSTILVTPSGAYISPIMSPVRLPSTSPLSGPINASA